MTAADDIALAIVAALALAGVEIVALGTTDPALIALTCALMAPVGLAIGALIVAQEWIVARSGVRGLRAALIRALGGALLTLLVARSLFDGASASRLPGAAWGFLWVPALVYAASVAVCAGYARYCTDDRGRVIPGRGWAVVAAALSALIGCEWANRTLHPSGYPDVHAFLVVVSVAFGAIALCIGARALGVYPVMTARAVTSRVIGRGVLALAVLVGLSMALAWGADERAHRQTIATEGTHTRHLVRVWRELGDIDGDGFSSVLGGGDCDDTDADIHPAALERPGNGIDDDCDGVAYAVGAMPVEAPSNTRAQTVDHRAERDAWYASADVRTRLQASARHHVVLISVDTLRADELLPEQRANSLPHIDALWRRSVVFERAFASSSGTDISIGGLMTGRIDPFVPLEPTLAEAMRGSGRITHGVIPREVLRYAGRTLLTRGLMSLDEVVNDRERRDIGSHTTSGETTDRGLAFIDRARAEAPDARLFLWVHYFDIHEHHQLPFALAFDPGADSGLSEQRRRYRALVRLSDREIGRLLDGLSARGLDGETIVVLLSDHGESMAEDPRLPDHHGLYVYNPLVHVPLAIHVPGVSPQSVPRPVSLIDVYPTLLELIGLPIPEPTAGSSLLPHLFERAPASLRERARTLVINDAEQWGVIAWPYKLMVRPADNLFELYDLTQDFIETRDLSGEYPARVHALKQSYAQFPRPHLDRTPRGRRWRERQARPPRHP